MTFLQLCAKKTNPVTKMRFKKYVFRAVILSFLHRAEDMSFHDETLQVCRKHVYVHHQKNSEFLKMFYYFLWFFYLTRSIWARVPKWISGWICDLQDICGNGFTHYPELIVNAFNSSLTAASDRCLKPCAQSTMWRAARWGQASWR